MGLYPVLDSLRHDGKRYGPGDTVELDEEDARKLQALVPPVAGQALAKITTKQGEDGGASGQSQGAAQPQAETNTNGKDDQEAQEAGGGEDGTAQDVPGQPQTSGTADAPATKPAKPKKG